MSFKTFIEQETAIIYDNLFLSCFLLNKCTKIVEYYAQEHINASKKLKTFLIYQ